MITPSLIRLLLVAPLFLLLGTPGLQAQEDVIGSADDLDALYIDFSVPDLSAFTLLGLDGSEIARPGNIRELSVALADAVGGFGEKGVGLELAPFRMGRVKSIGNYNGIRDRFTVSLAGAQEEDTGTRLAAGIRWVPFDRADPYDLRNPRTSELHGDIAAAFAATRTPGADDQGLDFDHRVRRFLEVLVSGGSVPSERSWGELTGDERAKFVVLRAPFDTDDADSPLRNRDLEGARAYIDSLVANQELSPGGGEQATLDALVAEYRTLSETLEKAYGASDARLNELVGAAKKSFREDTWNAFALQLAVGGVIRTPGDVDSLEVHQAVAFASLAAPVLSLPAQLILHAKGALNLNGDENDEDVSATFGGRLLIGNSTRRFSLEGLYGTNDERLGTDRYRVLVGGEVRLADGVYLELATGVNLPDEGSSNFLTLGSLRYGLRPDRRFSTGGQ